MQTFCRRSGKVFRQSLVLVFLTNKKSTPNDYLKKQRVNKKRNPNPNWTEESRKFYPRAKGKEETGIKTETLKNTRNNYFENHPTMKKTVVLKNFFPSINLQDKITFVW